MITRSNIRVEVMAPHTLSLHLPWRLTSRIYLGSCLVFGGLRTHSIPWADVTMLTSSENITRLQFSSLCWLANCSRFSFASGVRNAFVADLLPPRWTSLSLLFIVASEHRSLSSVFSTLGVLNGCATLASQSLFISAGVRRLLAVLVFLLFPLICAVGFPVRASLRRMVATVCLLIPNSSAIATLVICKSFL